MKPTDNIGFLLQHLAFSMIRQNDKVLQEKLGIGFSQFKILSVLQGHPNIQQKQIAEQLGQTEASISRQIKLMYDEGLLQSIPRPENRREHVATLTPRGLRVCEQATDILNRHHAPIFKNLSANQQQQLRESLQILHDYTCQNKFGMCK